MAHVRLVSPLSRLMYRPLLWDDEEDAWPNMTMTEGLDMYEEGDAVYVKAPVPGVTPENVDVTFEDGVLRITARQEENEEEKNKKRVVYRKERIVSFDYTTTLPRAVDPKTLTADVEDGVLIVSAKIAEAAKPQKISVQKRKK